MFRCWCPDANAVKKRLRAAHGVVLDDLVPNAIGGVSPVEVAELDAGISPLEGIVRSGDVWTLKNAKLRPTIVHHRIVLHHARPVGDLNPDPRPFPIMETPTVARDVIAANGVVDILPIEPEPRPHVIPALILLDQEPSRVEDFRDGAGSWMV